MSTTLLRNTFITTTGVVLFAAMAVVFFPVFWFAVVIAILVIATIVASTKSDADTRCLNTEAADIYVNVGGVDNKRGGCNQRSQQKFFHG